MAINPSRYDTPGSFIGTIDWSPLQRIGEQLQKNREEAEDGRTESRAPGTAARHQSGCTSGGAAVAVAPWPTPQPAQQAAPAAPRQPVDALAMATQADPMARYARATSAIESGSPQGNYRLVGPPTRSGDRAFGRYQVMGANVPDWTERYYGQRLTPREFLINPEAQDAVYKGEFGRLADKYGPTGAAKAWFAGERGMNNPRASDGYTTVSAYADRFNRNLGLPPEITDGTSRPGAQSALAFDAVKDRAVNSITSNQPQQPAIGAEQMAALYRNPVTRPLAIGLLQKQLDPGSYDFKVVGDNLVRTNSRTGRSEIMMTDVKNDYEVKTVKDSDGNERLVRVKKQGPEGPIDAAGAAADASGKGGKLPANYRWADPNDHSKGVEPIPGATPEKIGDEIVARIGLAKSFMSTLPELRQRVERGDVGIENWQNHAQAIANVGTPGETKRMLDAGAESLIRLLTGAGMSQTEAEQNAAQYRITPRDTKFTITSKINGLERHLTAMGELLGKGRGGGNLLTAPSAAPAPAAPGAPVKITTDAEYDALPPKTVFVGPDGKPRRKP
ncbi:hypothetical protein [Bradyrhizobium sp. SEMIA]|uniref:hypothetical protein n=1 Tax=Bradyrhizobium sp. SEMIA TaxID=2597515 RepID=UPI0018A37392|nr:hypothetical protein [Bradyrhizobium sp. SEMIA]QOG23160.1 hypothetical protein FOM02_43850 [Bradyrhizobium sp. SEMIA]